MWKYLILIMLLSITSISAAPRAADYKEDLLHDSLTYEPMSFYDYDYDYDIGRESIAIQPAVVRKATQRPLVKVWNNLVRNMRLNIPRITWNVTNPLSNFLNKVPSNVTQPPKTNLNLSTTTHKNPNKKRKNSISTTNKNNKKPKQDQQKQQQKQQVTQLNLEQPQEESQSIASGENMFFLDPITNEYYVVKRVSSSDLQSTKEQVTTKDANIKENVSSSSSLNLNEIQLTTDSSNIEEEVSSSLKPNKVQLTAENSNTDEHASSISSLKPDKEQLTTGSTSTLEPEEEQQMLEEELIKPDDDVQVVAEIIDTPDEISMDPQEVQPLVVDHDDTHTFRNYISSYMRDDRPSKRRQQVANPKREKLIAQRPRRVLYILRGW